MATWGGFAQQDPELADAGAKLLAQFGVGLGFLATARKDGGSRVLPVCPILSCGSLYVFVTAVSPKKCHLLTGGRFALHPYLPR